MAERGETWHEKAGNVVVETDGVQAKTLLWLRESIVNRATFLKKEFCQNQHKTEYLLKMWSKPSI